MARATLAELPGWAGDLLLAARVAHLGLLDEQGHPRVQPVTFAVADGRLWSAIDDHKPKRIPPERLARIRRLRADPRATLTVDRYADDWSALAWVQVIGVAEIVAAADAPVAVGALQAKYRPYAEQPPSGPLVALAPQRCLCWRARPA